MLRALLAGAIDHGAHHQRHAARAAEQIRPVGRLIDDRIGRQEHEIHARMEHDGPHPGQCRTDRQSRHRVLRDGTVENARPAELAVEAFQARARIPGAPQPLPQEENAGIGGQGLGVGLANGLDIS